jgi:hypothetical protein
LQIIKGYYKKKEKKGAYASVKEADLIEALR